MRHRARQTPEERAARSAAVKLIAQGSPMLLGSLVTMRRQCGKETCRCTRGHKHVSLYLATRLAGKRKMIYVPKELENKVRRWSHDGHQAANLIERACQASLDAFLKEKETVRANRKGERK